MQVRLVVTEGFCGVRAELVYPHYSQAMTNVWGCLQSRNTRSWHQRLQARL